MKQYHITGILEYPKAKAKSVFITAADRYGVNVLAELPYEVLSEDVFLEEDTYVRMHVERDKVKRIVSDSKDIDIPIGGEDENPCAEQTGNTDEVDCLLTEMDKRIFYLSVKEECPGALPVFYVSGMGKITAVNGDRVSIKSKQGLLRVDMAKKGHDVCMHVQEDLLSVDNEVYFEGLLLSDNTTVLRVLADKDATEKREVEASPKSEAVLDDDQLFLAWLAAKAKNLKLQGVVQFAEQPDPEKRLLHINILPLDGEEIEESEIIEAKIDRYKVKCTEPLWESRKYTFKLDENLDIRVCERIQDRSARLDKEAMLDFFDERQFILECFDDIEFAARGAIGIELKGKPFNVVNNGTIKTFDLKHRGILYHCVLNLEFNHPQWMVTEIDEEQEYGFEGVLVADRLFIKTIYQNSQIIDLLFDCRRKTN